MQVVPADAAHLAEWARLRAALWPDDEDDDAEAAHRTEAEAMIGQDDLAAFVAQAADGSITGFVEAALRRDYVNGCDTSPVAFVEGLYVREDRRRQGVARALVAAVEAWGRARGCAEMASDADLANDASHAMHGRLGFAETERVVYFRKPL